MDKAWRPPMGWNSWDSYGTTVTEQEVLDNAQVMRARLLPVGWDTVVIDIAWYDPTARAHGYNAKAPLVLDDYGRQLPDPVRFPSAADGQGFAPLAARIHDLGLRFGIHVMRGIPRLAVERNLPVPGTSYTAAQVADTTHVCAWNPDNYGLDQSHPGAQAWYDAQVDQFARWGVDYLKVDDMQAPFMDREIDAYTRAIHKAEQVHGHSMTLSLSPGTRVPTTHLGFLRDHAQLWRISDDLWDRWQDLYAQFARLARWAPLQSTGHWADADMLPLGHIGLRAERGGDRSSLLTADEQRTMLTLWAMGRSPLMVGGDLPSSDEATLSLLDNPALEEVTAGSADNGEIIREPVESGDGQGRKVSGEEIVWRALASDWADGTPSAHAGGVYAAVFWTGDRPRRVRTALSSLVGLDGADGAWTPVDLWRDRTSEPARISLEGQGADRELVALVPAHGVVWVALDPR